MAEPSGQPYDEAFDVDDPSEIPSGASTPAARAGSDLTAGSLRGDVARGGRARAAAAAMDRGDTPPDLSGDDLTPHDDDLVGHAKKKKKKKKKKKEVEERPEGKTEVVLILSPPLLPLLPLLLLLIPCFFLLLSRIVTGSLKSWARIQRRCSPQTKKISTRMATMTCCRISGVYFSFEK